MSTYTNKANLPLPLYQAICHDEYDAGESDISTTSLSVPSRLWALKKLHGDKIVEDAADRIWSFMGSIGHKIAEKNSNDPRFIAEKRFYVSFGDVKIGGQIDLFDTADNTLFDYKVTSYWTAKEGIKPEWQQQASVNRFLLEKNGITVKAIKYIAIFRDWSKGRAGTNGMPMEQVMVFPITPWSMDETETWIQARIRSHYDSLKALPECTAEERWAKPDQWAVMKAGQVRAVKLHDTEEAAMAQAAETKGGYVEKRPGESVRCSDYCPVASFCSQKR